MLIPHTQYNFPTFAFYIFSYFRAYSIFKPKLSLFPLFFSQLNCLLNLCPSRLT